MSSSDPLPTTSTPAIFSLLDTDLYKLTMQAAVLRFFPSIHVTYTFTNRTPHMRLNRAAFTWLQTQVAHLADISLSVRELAFLRQRCPFFGEEYLEYLRNFRLRPGEQVRLRFDEDSTKDEGFGELHMSVSGLWVETILYEIPLLALTSEAYFRFVDTDWTYEGQEQGAYEKGVRLLEGGCAFSDFGTRRRRDFKTQDLVVRGLVRASRDVVGKKGGGGSLSGTSNVYMAMEHGVAPIGTVAHEWYMGIAAITDNYETANEQGLRFWLRCFGKGVLGVALTDTFGTPNFFEAFRKPIPATRRGSSAATAADAAQEAAQQEQQPAFAEVFTGIRQDSGDPKEYVKLAAEFYDRHGYAKRTIVFSDSLNVELCLEYKKVAEQYGFTPSFGVGTFFTNDFVQQSKPEVKSKPMNIVIKLSTAGGQPAVKISDNAGKNTGDAAAVKRVKDQLGYTERRWEGVEEKARW